MVVLSLNLPDNDQFSVEKRKLNIDQNLPDAGDLPLRIDPSTALVHWIASQLVATMPASLRRWRVPDNYKHGAFDTLFSEKIILFNEGVIVQPVQSVGEPVQGVDRIGPNSKRADNLRTALTSVDVSRRTLHAHLQSQKHV